MRVEITPTGSPRPRPAFERLLRQAYVDVIEGEEQEEAAVSPGKDSTAATPSTPVEERSDRANISKTP